MAMTIDALMVVPDRTPESAGPGPAPGPAPRDAAMDGTAQRDDWWLLARLDTEPFALATLFDRHKDYVFRLACGFLGDRPLAEDVVQEVFLRVAQGHRRWHRRGQLRTLLYQIALNVSREQRRRTAREADLVEDALPAVAPRADPPPLRALARALETLPERQREAVVMRYLEELSTRDTARVMQCREGTVKAHLHRAVTALRRVLSPARPDPPRP